MDFFHDFINLIINTEKEAPLLLKEYGTQLYWILFVIIFAETGFVVTPFLPGDSLIFLVGSLASIPGSPLNIMVLGCLLSIAAVGGNTVNYEVGRFLGPRVFSIDRWFFRKKYLDNARKFYDNHGGKAIVLSRFMPILRTFAPFVAGIGKMKRSRFQIFNLFSGIGWVFLFLMMGYFFGKLDFVQKNLKLVTIGIIVVSCLPVLYEYIKARRKNKETTDAGGDL